MQHVYTGVTVCHRVGCWNPNAEVILLHLKIIANKTGNWNAEVILLHLKIIANKTGNWTVSSNPKNTLNTLYTSKSCQIMQSNSPNI
jgi:hypothetical protein